MRLEREAVGLAANGKCDEKKLINRLRRVEGQLRGVERLINDKADCGQVLTQLSAAKAALDQLSIAVVGGRIKECVNAGSADGEIDELLSRFLKGVMK